jgi:hypothetical protein
VTITLSQQAMIMFSSDTNPLSVKIGTLAGRDILRDELKVTAVFDIPADETTGMKDVSIEFPAPQFPGGPGGLPLPGELPPSGEFPAPQFPGQSGLPPEGGFQPPSGGFPAPNGQGITFTRAGSFEIQLMK